MSSEKVEGPVRFGRRGPHGYGDPDDKRLRKVEKDVLIKNKVREAAKELCKDPVSDFKKCAEEAGFTLPFRCRNQNDIMMDCLTKWFYDPELNEKMKIQYLEERSEYRRTGIKKKLQKTK